MCLHRNVTSKVSKCVLFTLCYCRSAVFQMMFLDVSDKVWYTSSTLHSTLLTQWMKLISTMPVLSLTDMIELCIFTYMQNYCFCLTYCTVNKTVYKNSILFLHCLLWLIQTVQSIKKTFILKFFFIKLTLWIIQNMLKKCVSVLLVLKMFHIISKLN